MQREIKFRVFDKETKAMYEVNMIDYEYKYILYVCNGFYKQKFFNKIELMQFTGLYDKNDNEIYEGDIVRISLITSEKSAVTYEKGSFYVKTKQGNFRLGNWKKETLEVLGNIYKKPELLK